MKIALAILLTVLTLLAVTSGIAKILLVPQETEFFGRYGFSSALLIAFGATQVAGGLFLPLKKT